MQRHSTADDTTSTFAIRHSSLVTLHSSLCIAAFAAWAANADIYLNAAAVGGANDGAAWSSAYTNLAEAVNALNAAPAGGRTLRVAQGFYVVTNTLSVSVAGFSIEGGYAAAYDGDTTRDTELYRTVLTADKTLDDCYRPSRPGNYGATQLAVNGLRVVKNGQFFLPNIPYNNDKTVFCYSLFKQGASTSISPALTIGEGAGGAVSGIAFYGFCTSERGVVISVVSGAEAAMVTNCLFAFNNTSTGIQSASSSTTISNCRFLYNTSKWIPLVALASDSLAEGCVFKGNIGAIANSALFFTFSGKGNTVRDCAFEDNCGYVSPGFASSALVCYCSSAGGGAFESCLFTNNVSGVTRNDMPDNPSFFTMLGGGVVSNCLFSANTVNAWAAKDGGYALISPMASGAHSLTLADCVFTRNTVASPSVAADNGNYVLGVVGNNYNGLALTVRNCVFDDNRFSYGESAASPILVRGAFTKGSTSQLTFVNNTVTGPRPEGALDILQYGTGHTKALKVYNSLFLYDGDILDNLFSASTPALWDVRSCAIQNLDAAHLPADIVVTNGLTTDPVPLDVAYAPASRVPGLDAIYTADAAVPATESIRGAVQTLPPAVASSLYLVARRSPLAGGTVDVPAQAVAPSAAIAPVTATPASAANRFLGWYEADANGDPGALLTADPVLSATTVPALAALAADTVAIAAFSLPQLTFTIDLGECGTFDDTGLSTTVLYASEGDAFPAIPAWTPSPAWHWTGWSPALPTVTPGQSGTFAATYVTTDVRVLRVVPAADQEPGVAQDGLTWATAYTDIITAYRDAATWRGEVWIKEGDYKIAATIPILSQVAVRGGFAGTETTAAEADPALHPTVLTGDISGNDAWKPGNTSTSANWKRVRDATTGAFNTPNPQNDADYWRTGGNTGDNTANCFVAADNAVTNVAFSGLTFTGFTKTAVHIAQGGEGVRLDDCRFIACGSTTVPAVLYTINAATTVSSCSFVGCYSAAHMQSSKSSHVITVTNCLFDASVGDNYGAALFFGPYSGSNNAKLVLTDSRFTRNADNTHNSQGSCSLTISTTSNSALVEDCAFVSNRVVGSCAANVLLSHADRADFVRCRFTDNIYKSSNSGAVAIGGGITKAIIKDCYFGNNTATVPNSKRVSVIQAGSNMMYVDNSTFERNAIALASGATSGYGATISFTTHNAALSMINCLVADNALPSGDADLDLGASDGSSHASCPLWFVNTVFWGDAADYVPANVAGKNVPLQVQNAAMKNFDTNAFASVYSNVGLDTNANPRVALRAKDGPNGAVARGLLAGSPFAKAGCRIWHKNANWYIYDAARKRYHSLDRSYSSASNVPQADDPVPPDAFGRPRKIGHIAYGPLNAASPATTLTLR